MASLEQYLYDMEAMPDEEIIGEGLIVLPLAASTTGTCGVTTPEAGLPLPLPAIAATGSWLPLGVCELPTLAVTGNVDSWHPAWGGETLPLPEVAAQGSLALLVDLALTPLFLEARAGALGRCVLPACATAAGRGAAAALELPLPTPYGLSGLNRLANLACALPRTSATAWSCSLDDPVTNAAGSDAVVALLCQGIGELALAATSLAGGESLASLGADALAGTLLAAVAESLAYVADDGEVWTCAMGTYTRGTGDCEDGAVLLHGLLLAAGLPADRLVTVFGRVGVTRLGHAWVTYRRVSDGNWVVLDWTAGTASTPVTSLPPIESATYYALVDYALTSQAFFAVRQRAATFFPKSWAVDLALPEMVVSGEAALGATMACALEPDWLRASARGAATAKARLPRPKVAARAGGNHGSATLADLALVGRTALEIRAILASLSVTAAALGAWARAGAVLRPALEATSLTAHRIEGQTTISRARLAATGLPGSLGVGQASGPRMRLAARAWPGGLARFDARLSALGACGQGLPTGPGQGSTDLTALDARGLANTAETVQYHWQTAIMESWS